MVAYLFLRIFPTWSVLLHTSRLFFFKDLKLLVSNTFGLSKFFGKLDKTFTKWPAKSIVKPMAVLKGSVFWTLGLYSCPNSSKLHDGCLSNFQICPSGCLLHSGRLLFLAKSDLLVGNSIRSVIRYLRVLISHRGCNHLNFS